MYGIFIQIYKVQTSIHCKSINIKRDLQMRHVYKVMHIHYIYTNIFSFL